MTKPKVTVTMGTSLLHSLDEVQKILHIPSRSQAIEEALQEWLKQKEKEKLEREVETYYRSLSKKEKQEDKAWGKIVARSARQLWTDE